MFIQIISKEVLNGWELYVFLGIVFLFMGLMLFKPKILLGFFRFQRNLFINLKKQRLPDWSKAPGWAKYVAQDSTGTWRWHFKKPKLVDGFWVSQAISKYDHAGFSKIVEKSFEKSLQEKPK